jgi:hypothetical protein
MSGDWRALLNDWNDRAKPYDVRMISTPKRGRQHMRLLELEDGARDKFFKLLIAGKLDSFLADTFSRLTVILAGRH